MLRLLGLSHLSVFLSQVRCIRAIYWQLPINIKVKVKAIVCVRERVRACMHKCVRESESE